MATRVMKSPLDLLADAAAAMECTSPPSGYDSNDSEESSLYISPTSSLGSEFPPTSPMSPTADLGGRAHQLRPRKAAHKLYKGSRTHIKAKPELKLRRKEILERASDIRSLENSPVNTQQLHVLRMVYDEITMYPIEPWLALMAVILRRSLRQIKNWFSNERQKNRWGEMINVQNDAGERLRLRPAALELCEEWSDAFFEELLMIVHYRTARRLHWERTQATTRP